MSTGISLHLSRTPNTDRIHHWTLGLIPRIIVILATTVGIGGSIWTTAVASPDIGFNAGPLLFVFIGGLFLVWGADPSEEKGTHILCVWIMVLAYVGIIVGGAMVGIVDGTVASLDSLQSGWGDSWYGIGEAVGITSFVLFLIAGIVTSIVYARGDSQ